MRERGSWEQTEIHHLPLIRFCIQICLEHSDCDGNPQPLGTCPCVLSYWLSVHWEQMESTIAMTQTQMGSSEQGTWNTCSEFSELGGEELGYTIAVHLELL